MSWEIKEAGCAPRCQWNGGPISEVRTLMESKEEALEMLQAEPTKYEGIPRSHDKLGAGR